MTLQSGAIRLLMDLRRAGISDLKVLAGVERVPRDAFAPPEVADAAWQDAPLALPKGGFLPRPLDLAVMIQALALDDRHRVLQAPTNTGYEAAMLAASVRWVYSVDRERTVRRDAEERLRALGIRNVVSHTGAPELGWQEQAPFDRILFSAGANEVPEALIAQLRDGGLLVGPIGADPRHRPILRVTRDGAGTHTEVVAPTSATTPLVHPPFNRG